MPFPPHFFDPLVAGVAGLLGGFLCSIPTGPIGMTIINEGARRGFRWAALISLGAICMDFIYCAVAFAGFSTVFGSASVRAVMELMSFLATLWLGCKYLVVRELPATTPRLERIERRLHPHTAFMTGFVRVLGNPAGLLFWITLAAAFMSHGVVANTIQSKSACVAGMTAGAFAWFILLARMAARARRRLSSGTLVRLSHVSGAVLLLVAVFFGVRLVSILSQIHGP